MKNSTIKENNKNKNNLNYTAGGFIFLIAAWKLLSLHYKPIILPSPELTLFTIFEMLQDGEFWFNISQSFYRVSAAYVLSLISGTVIGVFMGLEKKADNAFGPFISMLQTIPNISWILLAIIWFGLNSKIIIFTIFISILPIFVINSREGIKNTDPELLEMADIYNLRKKTTFLKIYLPSIASYIRSAGIITVERTWKIGAMAELLSLDTGIGAGLYWARNNLQTERIFAWTIILILLGFLSSQLLKRILTAGDCR